MESVWCDTSMGTEDDGNNVHARGDAEVAALFDLGSFGGLKGPEAVDGAGSGVVQVAGGVDDCDVESDVPAILSRAGHNVRTLVGACEGLGRFNLSVKMSAIAQIGNDMLHQIVANDESTVALATDGVGARFELSCTAITAIRDEVKGNSKEEMQSNPHLCTRKSKALLTEHSLDELRRDWALFDRLDECLSKDRGATAEEGFYLI